MSPLLNLISLSGLADLAIKSALAMLLTLTIATLLGRASAARRHLVWLLGVTSLLLLPALSLTLPAWRVHWLPQWTAVEPEVVVTQPSPQTTIARIESPTTQPHAVAVSAPAVTPVNSPVSSPIPVLPAATAAPVRGPFPWLAAVWLSGLLLSLVPLAVGLWRLAAVHRQSQALTDRRWLALLDEVKLQLEVRRPVRLRQSSAAIVPLTWGAIRPVLLVPAEADSWPQERRKLVLLHELAHVRRWDWLTQLIAHLACAAYWFNPLVWLAARQMRIERERACDDLVLATGAKASDYAQELLALAAALSDSRLSALVAVPMARRSALEDRVLGILDPRRSRAALTTAAICLGAALAAAVIAPLAMLRAAPPEPAKEQTTPKPPADKPSEEKPAGKPAVKPAGLTEPRDPTAEEIEARKTGIRINVLNAKGDRGIAEFRVIAGVSPGHVTDQFEEKTGQAVINWQPHTCSIGKDGEYVWQLAKAYDEMALRVEADGYQPQVATGIRKANGVQHIVFMLTEDKGVTGRVLTPAGKPAVGATVAMAIAHKDIVWENGKLRGADDPLPEKAGDRWRLPLFVKTDAAGAFQLPTEFEPAAMLIIHESGVREIAYDAWQKSPEITLQQWGRIAGQVLLQGKPSADEEVTLIVHRHDYGIPGMIASYAKTRTDKEGRFTFDKVLPGQAQISRPIKPADPGSSVSEVILEGMFQHVTVLPGEPTLVLLGGRGRKVTGKFVGLASWEGATYHFHPTAPHIGFGGDDEAWKAFSQLKASPQGPLLFRDKQPVEKDGSFTIENMLPGRYQLFLSAPGFDRNAAYAAFQIEPETPGKDPAPHDLGEIKTVNKPAEGAQPAAETPAEKPAAKPAAPAGKPAEAKTVTIRGKAVDDATGEPIGKLITQAGKFDPSDPSKVTWGYSEGRSSARDGSFSTTVRWGDGWTARIVADGYIPQPVLTSAPPADKHNLEVTIRLKRGPLVKGVVLDHTGKPLADAAVFAVGPTSINLAAGKAWSSSGDGDDQEAQPVRTNAQGRFELPTGGAKSLAVSHATFDVWTAAIPESGEVTIRLPEPIKVEVELDIDGADKESVLFYQLLTENAPEFAGVQSTRELAIANPGKLTLAALPPGRYQVSRNVMNNLGEIGTGAMLDRQFFELKAGQTKAINYTRPKGARLRGKITWPAETKLMGTVVSVRSEKAEKDPFNQHDWTTTFASQTAAKDGTFLTERVSPGTYLLVAEAFVPLTDENRARLGVTGPSFRGQTKIVVPEEGEVTVPDLALQPIKPGE